MNIKKSALVTTLAGFLAAIAFAAQAQEPMGGEGGEAPPFEQLDTNADGAITTDEAQESWLADVFIQVDANRDGYVTKTEYETARG